ncbi:olfactory receptor 2G3-like [Microcaecilia unicolor]|uniref:Olfactory receptor 2G3-like n=1 Tax=Microcaecilia unicolor TaxID=1415580 RepID=A0A6P7XKP9_9AMPH|nr:olfactory receptor 2G3-like [Microcaecilia unicolor]
MAYDRYVAICNPLRYVLIMNRRVCVLLASASWVVGFIAGLSPTVFISQFSLCRGNLINHFFCDVAALMKLSCGDMHILEIVIFTEGVFFALFPLGLKITSYVYIISSILKIRSAKGRYKAFSTCSSHLTVVILFYGTVLCMYMRPTSMYSPDQNKLFSLLYTTVIPMLNPIIYSMRNEEDTEAKLNLMSRPVILCVEAICMSSTAQVGRICHQHVVRRRSLECEFQDQIGRNGPP